MGHFHEEQIARGRNQKDAEANACSDFLHENGHLHSIRDVTPISMRKVPPMKSHSEMKPGTDWVTGRRTMIRRISSRPDPSAPESEWDEEWTFEIHSHA